MLRNGHRNKRFGNGQCKSEMGYASEMDIDIKLCLKKWRKLELGVGYTS